MSTRSVCAVPTATGFRGRYVHSDGYPSHMVPTYLALVARDGLPAVLKKITEDRYGWSQLNPNQPDISGIEIAERKPGGYASRFPYDSPEYMADIFALMYSDGRFANEPGYGIAYTTVADQSSPDEWVETGKDSWGTEWAYVLTDEGIAVYERAHERYSGDRWDETKIAFFDGEPGKRAGWLLRGNVPWDATDYPDFETRDEDD